MEKEAAAASASFGERDGDSSAASTPVSECPTLAADRLQASPVRGFVKRAREPPPGGWVKQITADEACPRRAGSDAAGARASLGEWELAAVGSAPRLFGRREFL